MKAIQRINVAEIFEQINGVEEILQKDPVKCYSNMTHTSKEYYRNSIKEISQKTKISELYIASKALALANNHQADRRKGHIGYYLIGKGKIELKKELGLQPNLTDFP